jgi:hypothetical protein
MDGAGSVIRQKVAGVPGFLDRIFLQARRVAFLLLGIPIGAALINAVSLVGDGAEGLVSHRSMP